MHNTSMKYARKFQSILGFMKIIYLKYMIKSCIYEVLKSGNNF